MKLLTIGIPCYNSEDYMEKAIESALVGGNDVEIIVVNDGSKDRTAEIADRYAAQYPEIVHVIHKSNGGHGSGVNAALDMAEGKYFKVLDSDDWLDSSSYLRILGQLKKMAENDTLPDMMLANYVYEKEGKRHKKVLRLKGFPKDTQFTWSDIRCFYTGHYILMHSVMYRTALLRDCGIRLPEHTFYVDNLYVYLPLPYVKTMYYMDEDLYRYYIGRTDQSVNEKIMIGRIDQQLRVNRMMLDGADLNQITNPKCREYMMRYVEIVTTISTVLLLKAGDSAALGKKEDLWKTIREQTPELYRWLTRRIAGKIFTLPHGLGHGAAVAGYTILQKIVGFN